MVSIMICIKKRSFSAFFETFWGFSSAILSDLFAHRIRRTFSRTMAAIWLLASIVLIATFGAKLLDQTMRER
jgi:hypothetical protein